MRKIIALTLIGLLIIGSFGACAKPGGENGNGSTSPDTSLDGIFASFAEYKDLPVDVTPSVAPYSVAGDFSNVINIGDFAFSEEALEVLQKNYFLVGESWGAEFFDTYETNRYQQIPNFITTDSMLHNYHLYFSYLLRSLEKDFLYGELYSLTDLMLEIALDQYEVLKGTSFENSAKRNVAFFSVAAELLEMNKPLPAYVKDIVNIELANIDAHSSTMGYAEVINLGANKDTAEALYEDYTQYVPRSHYTTSEELKRYFKTMMWYGRMTFRAGSEDETKSAVLITLMLQDEEGQNHWSNIYDPSNFFVGKSDDLGFREYGQVMEKVYGQIPKLEDLTKDSDKWDVFKETLKNLDPPAINSVPIFDENITEDRDEAITGFRFMGQRFTLDASIFQRLIYREVKENPAGDTRNLPRALDVPAAMGSDEALDILDGLGETSYENYKENMKMMRDGISGLNLKTKTQNLYWSWLYMLEPLTKAKGEGYPMFMQNQAWVRKQLETYLGSWAELKHDTILYAKQSYAEMGGWDIEEKDDRGYVEPNPAVFGRLASLTRMTIDGLGMKNYLKEDTKESLEILETMALKLKVMAEKELIEEPLTEEEYDFIRSFGGQLEHLWLEAMSDKGDISSNDTYENPASLVADVATDPSGTVLEVATGYVNDIYVIVPVDGTLRIAKGAVFSFYEFEWPASDRLTDEKWREMLRENQAPAQPEWTRPYTVKEAVFWW